MIKNYNSISEEINERSYKNHTDIHILQTNFVKYIIKNTLSHNDLFLLLIRDQILFIILYCVIQKTFKHNQNYI